MAGLLSWEGNIFHLERYFHKEIARVQSVWYAQQSERGIKYPKSSKHIQRLYRKKQNAVKDYLHKVTRWIAEYCRKEDIRCVVVGDIRNIRKEKDMGHKTNQKFHGLPYNKLYIMLEYKLKLYGIQLIKQEESYTSQCSPFSPEISKRYAESSNRKERGMYITDGVRFNADAVGAFNILRKYLSVSGKQKELSVTGLKTSRNNKSSCIAERQAVLVSWTHPEKRRYPARFQMLW